MQPLRFVGLIVILLAVHGWCKPAKSTEGDEYSDDDPPSDYNDDDDTVDDNDPDTIEEPPQILSKAESIHVTNGSTIWLPCLLKNTDRFAVTWKRNEETLYLDSTPMTLDTQRIVRLANNTLVIYNATRNDTSDDYECSILHKPPITIKHKVLVDDKAPAPYKPPLIRVIPQYNVEVSAGENFTLGCEMRTQPTPHINYVIKWFHESTRIGIDGPSNNYITIYNASRNDKGRYVCFFEDGSPKPPMGFIIVSFVYAPEIEAKKELVHTGLGVESDLSCFVHAHPNPKVTWYKNQTEVLPEKGRIEIKKNKNLYTLKILHTKQEDLGEYTCAAENKMGRTEKIIRLTGAPSQAIVYGGEVSRSDSNIILKWRLQSYSPITEYKLEYRRKGDVQWIILKPTVTNGKDSQFTVKHVIEGLQPGSYEAILTARNDFGWSQPSEPHIFTTEFEFEEAENVKGPAAASASQPVIAIATLFLVVSSCAFTSL
ncbi:protein amalgam isoform X1 [Ptiloglossa arizonensis]|uniref:protein amalgam isoform X1 n=1 Tax=Ptiloglossa arizonensis TaxID=3350558 RepID=UPI003FA0D3F7